MPLLPVREAPSQTAQAGQFREVQVVLGLAGGAQVSGWLRLPSVWRVPDLINNVREPILTLGVGSCTSDEPGSITVTRSNLAWIGTPEADPLGTGDNDTRGVQAEHPVIVHVGSFQLAGTITTHLGVQWSNFLVGRAGPPAEFFVLSEARSLGDAELAVSSVAVNVGLVAALVSAT